MEGAQVTVCPPRASPRGTTGTPDKSVPSVAVCDGLVRSQLSAGVRGIIDAEGASLKPAMSGPGVDGGVAVVFGKAGVVGVGARSVRPSFCQRLRENRQNLPI